MMVEARCIRLYADDAHPTLALHLSLEDLSTGVA